MFIFLSFKWRLIYIFFFPGVSALPERYIICWTYRLACGRQTFLSWFQRVQKEASSVNTTARQFSGVQDSTTDANSIRWSRWLCSSSVFCAAIWFFSPASCSRRLIVDTLTLPTPASSRISRALRKGFSDAAPTISWSSVAVVFLPTLARGASHIRPSR